MMEQSSGKHKEFLIIKDCNHYHQVDAIIIIPLESFFKACGPIQTNYVQLYLINSKTALDFFRRTGFYNSPNPDNDFKDCKQQIQELQDPYF
jgi:hypothetical protein